jgi:hypothetical protein
MVMSPAGLGPEDDYAGEGRQELERMLHKDHDRKYSAERKLLVVTLKGLVIKTN